MATFPRTESDILTLAQAMANGLTDNPTVYPAPPVIATDLQAVLDSANSLISQVDEAKSAYEQVLATKNAGIEELTDAMKADIRYAENTTNYDNAKLLLIGWSGRKTPSAADPPGQPLDLRAPSEGEGTITLEWDKPETGGKVTNYKIERRERPAGSWSVVDTSYETEKTLTNQERAKEWEYRVISTSPAGESSPSNTVMAVL